MGRDGGWRAAMGAATCAGVLLALPAAATAATPEPGLWIGTKGDVQQSFTVRADGARRVVTDVVTFCGTTGFLADESANETFDARRFPVRPDGRVEGWAARGRELVRLGRDSAVLARTYATVSDGCPQRDFRNLRVRRGRARPIQDGFYAGERDQVYDLRLEVAGGGALLRDLAGYAGVPGPCACPTAAACA